MRSKLTLGDTFIMHTRSGESQADEAVVVELDERGAAVVWPKAIEMFDALRRNDMRKVPDPLVLKSGGGWLTLQDGVEQGTSASTLGYSERRLRYFRAISTGARGIDYSSVHGMSSTVDGLATWTGRVPVTQKVAFDDSSKRIDELTITAKNLDPLPLGGPLNLELTTSYTHSPYPKGGAYQISTALEVRTRNREAVDWGVHAQEHRMIQDLMCLAYGRPCLSHIGAVMREDDQELEPRDERRFWREAYEPGFGRSARGVVGLTDNDKPLFYFDDTDPAKVTAWLTGYALWSRPTWIAVTPLFHADLPVESRLLHVAVALESLGAAIAERDGKKAPKTFEGLLKLVCNSLGFAPEKIVGKPSTAEWCREFNRTYKGVKHADNLLPDPLDAFQRAQEGLTLIRCWLGVELGVSSEVLLENLTDGR